MGENGRPVVFPSRGSNAYLARLGTQRLSRRNDSDAEISRDFIMTDVRGLTMGGELRLSNAAGSGGWVVGWMGG